MKFIFGILLIFIFISINYYAVPILDDNNEKHAFEKRSIQSIDEILAMLQKNKKQKEIIPQKTKSQPIDLYAEAVIVTDYSVFLEHQKFANTTNQSLVLLHMKVYFTQIMNIVNQRYVDAFKNDPDLRLYIKPKEFIFQNSLNSSLWTDRLKVGDSNFTFYNNREVILSSKTLDEFRKFMEGLNLTYDIAIGLTNKDLWLDDGLPHQRTLNEGHSYTPGVCSDKKYSIIEINRGFETANIIAHEMAHNFGAFHDGSNNKFANECSAHDFYLMTPLTLISHNLNKIKFSNCSIAQIKSTLLTPDFNNASENSQCLLNKPITTFIDTSMVNEPDIIWSLDDQCKFIYGQNASFIHAANTEHSICSNLKCFLNNDNDEHYFMPGVGALDKTPCGSGKSCLQSKCVKDSTVPTGNCIFGDGMISMKDIGNIVKLPTKLMTCKNAFDYLLNQSIDVVNLCMDQRFKINLACCETCSRLQNIECIDKLSYCSDFKKNCNKKLKFKNGIILDDVCKYTCGICKRPAIACETSGFLCKNGGTCVNKNKTMLQKNELFGFSCLCKNGYFGDFCEKLDPCLIKENFCMNNGTCQRIGSNGYTCVCSSQFYGKNCELGRLITSNSTITLKENELKINN